MQKTFQILFLLYTLGSVNAQEFDIKKLNNYFDVLDKEDKFMGSVAIAKNGKTIYNRSCGFADIEASQKANNLTKYRIGSITKTFTAVLVVKAIEEKLISSETSLENYYPHVKNADKITIRHLLRHSSGIHNFTKDFNYLQWNTKPKTEAEMMDIISKGGSDFAPGSKNEYSNSNFVILTYILQDIYNMDYAKLVEEKILKPLKLTNTRMGDKINSSKNEAASFKFLGKWIKESETDISIPLGAGGIISTPTDLAAFANGLFGGKLVTQESLDSMKSVHQGYGIGLFPIPFYENIGYGHNGEIDAFSSVLVHYPESGITFALTSNGHNFEINDITIAALSAAFGKDFKIPIFTQIAFDKGELKALAGTYVSKQFPVKLLIENTGSSLTAQPSGQQPFLLEAMDKTQFVFKPAQLKFTFDSENQTMILHQGTAKYTFVKE